LFRRQPKIAPPARTGLPRLAHALFGHKAGYIAILILTLIAGYLFAGRGMRFFLIPSASMEPTLLRHDYIVALTETVYHRGDIVVIREPENADYIVKRIVGLAGDTLSADAGALYINGEYASEPYVLEPMEYSIPPVTIPEGRVFFLGDNRNISDDSHINLDTRPLSDIVGKVRFIYHPYPRFGPIPSYPLTNLSGH